MSPYQRIYIMSRFALSPSMPSPFQSYKREIVYGTICISPSNRILLVKGRTHRKWSFPKGHLERSEGSFRCALRELFEETGICVDYDAINPCDLPYKKFKTGNYYVLDLAEEIEPQPRDRSEIAEARWMNVIEIQDLVRSDQTNVDVRLFARILEQSPPPSP